MIRVGVIADSFEVGGQERGCLEVLRRLDRRRFAPSLYLFRPGSLLDEARALGIPIVVGYDKPGVERGWTKADGVARHAWRSRLAASLRDDGIDVALVWGWIDGIAAAQAAGMRAIVERVDGPALAARIRDKSACQRIICESRLGRDLLLAQRRLLRCRREQMVVVPNAVDLVRFDPARYDRERCRERLGFRPDDFVFGSVARLAVDKNQVQLLRAARFVLDERAAVSGIQVVVAGRDRGCRAELEDEAHRLGIADRVHFLGERADVPEVLRALDVYVLTSLHEGTPFALLEAMAMGLPVVANQVGAVLEVVRGNGYVLPPLVPEDTAAALVELLDDPELRRRLGRRSRAVAVGRHGIDGMIRGYERVLADAFATAAAA